MGEAKYIYFTCLKIFLLIWNGRTFKTEKMKTIHSSLQVKIPEDITATVNNRVVTIKGKRGLLRKSFKHTQLDVKMLGKKRIQVEKWFGNRKDIATVRTVISHIEHDERRHLWLPLQDEICLRPFPHQHCHSGRRQDCGGSQLPGGEVRPPRGHVRRR